MEKPWIGIPTRYHEKSEYIGQIRHYLDAVLWAGGLPLMIPTVDDRAIIAEYIEHVDGILLPGSPTDIDPKRYGAGSHEKLGKLYPERDATDFAILDLVESQKDVPVLGICFGIQSLNVYRGGSLVQDIPSLVEKPAVHDNDDDEPPVRHTVRVAGDSIIGKLAGQLEMDVNSYHHQAPREIGRGLRRFCQSMKTK